ncbi:16S rRNA processing protein RimM [Rhodopseudomonas julia]|uniref:Ribosome maturation factor RimM n=1 Tax=Rhodopseudomonas julia TaxID=200617 RepID=A0ABU0C7R7_9BRAD|nr:ribosome maturation factor RimM [Rhodopseudomonas julia]MDQ0325685.1 16S rRNA processing protein RimM [Rhodopseudomonas julia]
MAVSQDRAAGDRLIVAKIGRAHGVRGEVRVKTFTADPLALADYSPLLTSDGRSFSVKELRADKGDMVVARFKGVSDRNAAETLNGTMLFVARTALPEPDEDEFYYADLIGLAAEAPDGSPLGRVVAVHDFGGGDILEVKPEQGETLLLSFTREVVPSIDLAGGRIVVDLPTEIEVREDDAASEDAQEEAAGEGPAEKERP